MGGMHVTGDILSFALFQEAMGKVADAIVDHLVEEVKYHIFNYAPIEFGSLWLGTYISSPLHDTYWEAVQSAMEAGAPSYEHYGPLVEVERPQGKHTAVVGSSAYYTGYVHDGVRGHPGVPFLEEAALAAASTQLPWGALTVLLRLH